MAGIPQVITEDRASSAQFIDGSLRFDESKGQYLKFTPSASGNRRTQTLSVWIKNTYTGGNNKIIFGAGDNASGPRHNIYYNPTRQFGVTQNPTGSQNNNAATVGLFRDYSGWQHLVVSLDCTVGANSGQVRIYVNGKLQDNAGYGGGSAAYIANTDGIFNTVSKRMYLGHYAANPSDPAEFDGYMSQFYWIDGLALGPGYFGYTDPLTGTWRPKKFRAEGTTVNNGTNWSAGLTGTANSSGLIGEMFDGNLSSGSWSDSSGYTIAFPNGGVTATNNIKIYGGSGSANWYVVIDGTKTTINAPGGNAPAWSTTGVTGHVNLGSGTLTSIGTEGSGISQNGEVSGIEIDGVIMKDNTTQNLDFGTNGVYLPFDGNTPIGKDQSGRGNDWTPVNFNCSVPLNKATGAIPILQTDGSGGTAITGKAGNTVRTLRSSDKIVTASGGKYYIDGVETPTLNLIRGAYYIFDNSPGASSHPFKFSTTPDGTHNGGSAWTDGIQEDTSSGYERTRFFVPHTAPDTMYYYCSSHSGMGSQVNVTTDIFKADPYGWKNVFALPYYRHDQSPSVNPYESKNSAYLEGDPTVENIGNFYGASLAFDGTGDYIRATDSSEFNMATDDFTVEMWIYPKSTNHQKLVFAHTSGGDYGWANLYFDNGQLRLYSSSNGSSWISGLGPLVIGTPKLNEWSHVAVTRSGNTFRVFHNGVLTGTATSSASLMNSTGELQLGARNGTDNFTGNVQDLRIYKGIAKYTEDFTVGSTDPDVLLDTPSGVSYKTKLDEIEQGSISFNGTSDYLVIPASEDFNFEEDDWTIEMYVYFEDFNQEMTLIDWSNNGASTGSPAGRLFLDHDAYGGYIQWYKNSTVVGLAYRSNVIERRWHHISWHRDAPEESGQSDVMRIVVDGKHASGTSQGSNNVYGTSAGDLWIGRDTAGNYFRGKISNLRITKGTCVYPGEAAGFVDGPQPLTALANTKLLCCKSSTVASAAEVEPSSYINTRIPSGFSWWDAGAAAGWNGSGSNTSGGSSDYVSVALPTSGKIYWETVVTDPATYAVIGVTDDGGNAAGNDAYQDNMSGYYFNGNPPIYLAKRASANSTASSVTHGASTGTTWENGDILMWAVDCGSARMWIGRNGTWYASGNPAGGTNYAFHNMNVNSGGTYFKLAYITNSNSTSRFEIKTQANSNAIRAVGASASSFNPFVGDDINVLQGQESGYPTWNPINKNGGTLSDGNLKLAHSGAANVSATLQIPTTGRWYWEYFLDRQVGGGVLGIADGSAMSGTGLGNWTKIYGYSPNGNKYENSSNSSYGATLATGDLVGVKYDADTRQLEFYKNGSSQGVAYTVSSDYDYYPSIHVNNSDVTANFGQKPFKFPPPEGFQPLNLSNVQPEKVFARPDHYVGATLYTGSGETVSSRTIELPHAADLVWAKSRDRASSHQIADTVRGNNSVLQSNTNSTARNPTTQYNGGGISIIDGKTISLVKGSTNQANNENLNATGQRGVVWSWKAGGSSNTFNIDDVGYANASDVNMSVGALNSSVYDQSQRWRDNITSSNGWNTSYPINNAFNGSFDGGGGAANNGGGGTITFTPPAAITVTKLELSIYSDVTLTLPDGTTQNLTGVGSADRYVEADIGSGFSFTGSNSITISRTSSFIYLERIKINGKELVDNDITPANVPSVANTGSSVGTEQGFSIIKYNATGSNLTVSHGLSKRPGLIILKTAHSTSGDWLVWHQSLAGVDRFLKLNDTITQAQASNVFLSIDENTFGTGNDSGINSNGQQKIAYLWHDVPGLQKFGKWTNNNSNDGTFIELGFRPALILLKNTDNVEKWYWIDSSRHTYNEAAPSNSAAGAVNTLQPNTSNTEATSRGSHTNTTVDILSNGFKIRTTNPASGEISFGTRNYIYAAWAEAPSINLYGGHANAR